MTRDVTHSNVTEQTLQEANNRALRDYERLVERIATLGQTLGNARDLTAIFRALRDFAVVSVPCDGMMITLYDAEKETRSISYCWADNSEFDPKEAGATVFFTKPFNTEQFQDTLRILLTNKTAPGRMSPQ